MNNSMITNWNNTIDNDVVWFLGNMTLGPNSADYWLSRLNGDIKLIC